MAATTGSLGQGTSVAAGIAYGLKIKRSNQRVYLIVGDGELNEGQCPVHSTGHSKGTGR